MKIKYLIDASSFKELWERKYPPTTFPSLYIKLEPLILERDIHCIQPVFAEIRKPSDIVQGKSLREWLEDISMKKESFIIPPGKDEEEQAMGLSIEYRSKGKSQDGVSENDLLMVAVAKVRGWTVVTEERKQDSRPKEKKKYKIPLVCLEQKVRCINLLEFIQELGIRV